jgi:secreted trypsin-like serine protease
MRQSNIQGIIPWGHYLLIILFLNSVLCRSLAASQVVNSTTLSSASMGRIVGGIQPSRDRFPSYVRLDRNDRLHCGAVLISPQVILTAAHCVASQSGSFTAYVNAYDAYNQAGSEIQSVVRGSIHPSYNSITREYDLAVLQLKAPVRSVTSTAVNGDYWPSSGESIIILGLGNAYEGGSTTVWLNAAEVKIVDAWTCDRDYGGGKIFDNSMICARDPGQDACQGDSGGPALMSINGVEQVVGIVSWGRGCGNYDFPGVYSRVSTSKSWIDAKINQFTSILTSASFGSAPKNPRRPMRFPNGAKLVLRPRPTENLPSNPCADDNNAIFWVGSMRNLNCAIVRTNPQLNACIPGQPAYIACPDTCGACLKSSRASDELSTASRNQTPPDYQSQEDIFEFDSPDNNVQPSQCTDQPNASIYVNEGIKNVSCEWLASHSDWKVILCEPDQEAWWVCAHTCQPCACQDSPKGLFHYHNVQRSCLWLSLRNKVQNEVCHPNHEAWTLCPESCQSCSYP